MFCVLKARQSRVSMSLKPSSSSNILYVCRDISFKCVFFYRTSQQSFFFSLYPLDCVCVPRHLQFIISCLGSLWHKQSEEYAGWQLEVQHWGASISLSARPRVSVFSGPRWRGQARVSGTAAASAPAAAGQKTAANTHTPYGPHTHTENGRAPSYFMLRNKCLLTLFVSGQIKCNWLKKIERARRSILHVVSTFTCLSRTLSHPNAHLFLLRNEWMSLAASACVLLRESGPTRVWLNVLHTRWRKPCTSREDTCNCAVAFQHHFITCLSLWDGVSSSVSG